jgi:hypothetical protein
MTIFGLFVQIDSFAKINVFNLTALQNKKVFC